MSFNNGSFLDGRLDVAVTRTHLL